MLFIVYWYSFHFTDSARDVGCVGIYSQLRWRINVVRPSIPFERLLGDLGFFGCIGFGLISFTSCITIG